MTRATIGIVAGRLYSCNIACRSIEEVLGRFDCLEFNNRSRSRFMVVSVLVGVQKCATATPRMPVKNHTTACSGFVSVRINWCPRPSPIRESILVYERGDDCAL